MFQLLPDNAKAALHNQASDAEIMTLDFSALQAQTKARKAQRREQIYANTEETVSSQEQEEACSGLRRTPPQSIADLRLQLTRAQVSP